MVFSAEAREIPIMFQQIFTLKKKPDSLLLDSAKSGRLDKVISALVDGAEVEAKDKVIQYSPPDYKYQLYLDKV